MLYMCTCYSVENSPLTYHHFSNLLQSASSRDNLFELYSPSHNYVYIQNDIVNKYTVIVIQKVKGISESCTVSDPETQT